MREKEKSRLMQQKQGYPHFKVRVWGVKSIFSLDPPCLLNAHFYQTPCLQFVTQALRIRKTPVKEDNPDSWDFQSHRRHLQLQRVLISSRWVNWSSCLKSVECPFKVLHHSDYLSVVCEKHTAEILHP